MKWRSCGHREHGQLIAKKAASRSTFGSPLRLAKAQAGAGCRFRPAESGAFAIGEEEEPDPIVDGKIDLGALAAEFMILGLDPYPRKPGVDFIPPSSQEDVSPLWNRVCSLL
jgi:hypothetical protein